MAFNIGISLIQNELNGRAGWIAGLYYVKNCLNAIARLPVNEIPNFTIFLPENFHEKILSDEFGNPKWLRIVRVNSDRNGHSTELQQAILDNPCDLYFPFIRIPPFFFDQPMIGWIPDFQYKHFPEFFSSADFEDRDVTARFILEHSSKVICISQEVASDISQFYPEYKAKAVALPFVSHPQSSYLQEINNKVLQKYNIDRKFIYLPNQFWVHKNHRRVFEAWLQLKNRGLNYLLVCTGKLEDYRKPNHFKELKDFIDSNQLQNHIRILGFIERDDQIQLFRHAAAVIQPSLFEGWNTSIEDAKALGKQLILSDIPVHHEQCAQNAIFFDKYNSEQLSKIIEANWDNFEIGYNSQNEKDALLQYESQIILFARDLIQTFKSALLSNSTGQKYNRDLILKLNSELNIGQAHMTARLDVIQDLEKKVEQQKIELHIPPKPTIVEKIKSRMKMILTTKIS